MTDDDRARALLTMAAQPPGGLLRAPVAELVRQARTQHRRRRGIAVGFAVVATAAAVVVPTILVGAGNTRAPAGHHSAAPAPGTSAITYPTTGPGSVSALKHGHWSVLPTAPIPARVGQAAVWTGQQMLIWGGAAGSQADQLRSDGAAYDPATHRWATLPRGPLSARTNAATVWTGQDMFIWGGDDTLSGGASHAADDGALYNPSTGTWQQLPPSPLSARVSATALWTGSEVVVIGGSPAVEPHGVESFTSTAAYNPATNSWHRLPSTPTVAGDVMKLVSIMTGDSIETWAEWTRALAHSTGVGIDVFHYDLADGRWTRVHARGDVPGGVSDPLWTGSEIIMPHARFCPTTCPIDLSTTAWRLDARTNTWTTISLGQAGTGLSFWTGQAVLSVSPQTGSTGVWAPNTDHPTRLLDAPATTFAPDVSGFWTGNQLLIWGRRSPRNANSNSASGSSKTIGLSYSN
jgi:hypothetical protein